MLRQVTTRARRGSGPRAGGTARAQRGSRRGGQELEAAVGDSRSQIPGQAPDHEPAVLRRAGAAGGNCGPDLGSGGAARASRASGGGMAARTSAAKYGGGLQRTTARRWRPPAGLLGCTRRLGMRVSDGLERLSGRSSWRGCPYTFTPPAPVGLRPAAHARPGPGPRLGQPCVAG